MSEKRHRQQQRRQRRKARSGRAPARRRGGAGAEPADMLAHVAELSARDADQIEDALDAEQWASTILGMVHAAPLAPGEDAAAVILPGLLTALERLGTRRALATLRAVAAVSEPGYAAVADAAAGRLAARGLPEPAWAADLGTARPTAAALMHDDVFDDGLSVLVEFAGARVEPHTIGVYIDHNLGGLVKDVFLAGPLSEVRDTVAGSAPAGPALRDLGLAEARARAEAAFRLLDQTWDPPVAKDVGALRALIQARLRLLPDGAELPGAWVEVSPQEREALLEDFLSSPEGRRWRGDEDAEDVAYLAIQFGADYNHGGPLRWSPVVVELFMADWLARKADREPAFFERVPDVLRTWVTYAGRRRGVPPEPLEEVVATVDEDREEMLANVFDPATWGPAKAFVMAARDAGVDLNDPAQLQRFIDRYNEGLAA